MEQYFEISNNTIPLELMDLFKEVSREFEKKVFDAEVRAKEKSKGEKK